QDANYFNTTAEKGAFVKYFVAFPQSMRILKYVNNIRTTTYRTMFVDKKLDDHSPIGSSNEHADYFLDYILNRSPWAPLFITKDPEDVRTNGVIIDATNDLTLVVTATIAIRTLNDYPTFAYNFYRMRQLLSDKFPENLQYIVSALLTYGEGVKFPAPRILKNKKVPIWTIDKVHYKGYGNVMWFQNLTPMGVSNFLNGVYIEKFDNLLSSTYDIVKYSLFVRSWQSDGPRVIESTIRGELPVLPDIKFKHTIKQYGDLGLTIGDAYKADGVINLAKAILKYSTSKEASK
ncbi:hypothetical protein LCGC14_2651810, partial [marine sediment metagenome]